MNAATPAERLMPPDIEFELDGRTVQAHEGETILSAASRAGVDIPHLCFSKDLRPAGNLDHAGAAIAVGPEGF